MRNGSPKAVGSRTQGSYAMRTMIQNDRGDYDVDDGVYFTRDALKNEEGEDKSAPDARKNGLRGPAGRALRRSAGCAE